MYYGTVTTRNLKTGVNEKFNVTVNVDLDRLQIEKHAQNMRHNRRGLLNGAIVIILDPQPTIEVNGHA